MKRFLIISIALFLISSRSNAERKPNAAFSVLHIGDSQSEGYLGGIIFNHLRNVSRVDDIRLYGVGSSSPRHWGDARDSKNSKWLCKRNGRMNDKQSVPMKAEICGGTHGESVFSFLNNKKSDLVIFQFLGNSVGFSESFIKEKISSLLNELTKQQNCLFITSPPYYKDLAAKNELRIETQNFFLKAIGDRCAVVKGITEESLKSFASQKDNYLSDMMHLSKKGAFEFFKKIAPELPSL